MIAGAAGAAGCWVNDGVAVTTVSANTSKYKSSHIMTQSHYLLFFIQPVFLHAPHVRLFKLTRVRVTRTSFTRTSGAFAVTRTSTNTCNSVAIKNSDEIA